MKSSHIAFSIPSFAVLFLATSPVLAGTVGNIPEPGMLSLFGLGGVVLAAVAIRNRRNKK